MKTENFIKIKTESKRILSPKHGMLVVDDLEEKKAKQLWDEGFTFLALTKKGAAHYYKDIKSERLVLIINTVKSKEDVHALLSLSTTKAVKEAAKNRLKELS